MKEILADVSDIIGIDRPFLHDLYPPVSRTIHPRMLALQQDCSRMLPLIAPSSKKVIDKRRMAHKIAHASVRQIGRIKHIFAAASPAAAGLVGSGCRCRGSCRTMYIEVTRYRILPLLLPEETEIVLPYCVPG